jgi:integrase/recombinase XerD
LKSAAKRKEINQVEARAELVPLSDAGYTGAQLPAIISREGKQTSRRFLEFFTANIRNKNTRLSYFRAVTRFLNWCDERGVQLTQLEPMRVAVYIEQLTQDRAPQTVKQHLAAIRMLFDWFVIGQVMPVNPASSVRGPRYSIKKGKTPVLSVNDARKLLDSMDTSHVVGLRDRALIALMVYSFARVSAVVGMKVKDYYANGKRYWIRLHEKGGKFHEVPVHHNAEQYLDEYIEAAGIACEKNKPLFRTTIAKTRKLTDRPINRIEVYKMVKRRAGNAGLSASITCHTFRATGITAYLENGGTIEHAQQIAAHESPRTTKLYDRTSDALNLDEIERILI